MSARLIAAVSLLAGIMAAGAAPRAGAQEPSAAAALLAGARKAIGPQPALAGVKSLRLGGVSQAWNQYYGRMEGANNEFVTYALDTRILFPDHYETVKRRAGIALVRRTGFAGPSLLTQTRLPDGKVNEWSGADAMRAQRTELARLMLLMLLKTDTALALTLDQRAGSPSTLRFTGADDFAATVHLDPRTRLPLELRFTVRMVPSGEQRDYVMEVVERRSVNGLSLPSRLTTKSRGRITEKLEFTSIEVNPALTRASFGGPLK